MAEWYSNMRSLILCLLTLATVSLVPLSAPALTRHSNWQKGMVEIRPGQKLYVEQRLAEPGKQTIYMANGLTWSTRDWKKFVDALTDIDPGLGIVLYDMRGMGRTLLEYAPIRENITIDEQVEDLRALRMKLGIDGPTAIVGLSYGGGVAIAYLAKYPEDFNVGIAMAPFIERLTDQDVIINSWITQHRNMFPFDPRTKQELYDHYLRVLIYTTYPLAEPVLLENRHKLEATYRMVQGALNFQALGQIADLPEDKLHLVGAMSDDFVKPERLALFWEALKDKAASFLKLQKTKHKIPTERPEMAASWTYEIVTANPAIAGGAVFEGDPAKAQAVHGDVVIPLKKAGLCASILRAVLKPF